MRALRCVHASCMALLFRLARTPVSAPLAMYYSEDRCSPLVLQGPRPADSVAVRGRTCPCYGAQMAPAVPGG
ncbi:hypothetical protein GQ53DRAFT_89297 [Thozetella sp. PMI_491]|nr:hypothetical protein GQ53DRAFT_89297 [Thozetella sp. PMI_491]